MMLRTCIVSMIIFDNARELSLFGDTRRRKCKSVLILIRSMGYFEFGVDESGLFQ